MRILHVSLGLPPLRTGGLTRYCTEVMEAQAASGDEVALLYPGRCAHGRTRIRRGTWHGITTCEVVNPLPVALTYGVAEPDAFCAPCDNPDGYRELISELRPDVVHVHSFQGIHLEFFEAAREASIPVVFTTHDYYPICPRCTLLDFRGEDCVEGSSPERCAACELGFGMTARKSRVMQSGAYARMKDSVLVRVVRSHVKRGMSASSDSVSEGPAQLTEDVRAYGRLLAYGRDIFSTFSLVLANSTSTMRIYQKYFPKVRCKLLPITHAGLERDLSLLPARPEGSPLRIGYYGGRKAYKGYGTLLEAVRILDGEGVPFELGLYGDDYGELPAYAHAHDFGRVAPEEIGATWRVHDVVVVPSKWHETFGFVALEALCSGVPVVCSDMVGAKDLVDEGRVFRAGDAEGLARCLCDFVHGTPTPDSVPEGYPLSMDEQLEWLSHAYMEAAGLLIHSSDEGIPSNWSIVR